MAEPRPTLLHTRTHDGVRIAVWRYAEKARTTPVLLVHGLGSNRFDVDAPGRSSIARHLHRAGFDTWIVELRGAGASRQTLKKLTRRWCLDDYLVHDIPAAFRLIEEKTGSPSVHWVGHSLGGMLAYPMLVTADRRRIRSCVTIGAPSMTRISRPAFDAVLPLEHVLRRGPTVLPGYRALLKAGSLVAGRLVPLVGGLFMNVENCDPALIAFLARNAIEDVPMGVVLPFFEWYRTKRFRTHYGTVDVVDELERVATPLLVIAGATDLLTPLDDVRVPYERSGAREKELMVVGKAHGFSADYGHIDLVFGRRAPDEVFPRIVDWFARHDRREPAPAVAPVAAVGARG